MRELKDFWEYLTVDQNLSERTASWYCSIIRRILSAHEEISVEVLRGVLKSIQNPYTKANYIKAFRVFFKRYLNLPIADSFKIPQESLRQHLKTNPSPLFSYKHIRNAFKEAEEATGVKVTPQILREWFCNEMANLGVPDRYIDAFCGRTPKTILAKHYTDYTPQRLKKI